MVLEQCGGTVERYGKTGTVTVEQSNSDGTKWVVEQWNSDSGTVWWNTARVMVEKSGGTLRQCGGTVEQ